MNSPPLGPFLRYAGVGGLATAAHWLCLAGLVEAALVPAWQASGLGALLGAQLAFAGNRRYTFDHRGPFWPAWRRFMLTALAAAALGMAVVAGATAWGWHYLLAQALATAVVLVLGFVVNRTWSFSA